jgi:raffinose/stachyose/melibiose transport system permease protein
MGRTETLPARAGATRARRSARRGGYAIFLLPGLILFTLVILLPLVANIGISFTRWRGVGMPTWVGLSNYAQLMGDATFWASFRNNLAMIVAMAIIPTAIGLVLASLLFDVVARAFRRGEAVSSFFRAGFYLPQVLPVAVAGVVWGWIMQPRSGALNVILEAVGLGALAHNWLGDRATALPAVMAIMVWFQIGYPLVIFMAGLQRVDPEVLEAAAIDGATWLQRFLFITLPHIRPEIFVVLLTTTIAALKVFGPIFVLTRGGPGRATIVPSYFAYQNFFEKANVGYGAAIATIITLIIVLLTVVFINVQTRRELEEAS